MEVEELFGKYLYAYGVVEGRQLLESEEIDIVGGVDDLGNAEDGVGDWLASS